MKALGLSSEGTSRGTRVPNNARIARIRETMRWRGFDLTAYSDEEVATAAQLLGPSISPEGETTEASRQALADLLLQRRIDPEAMPEHIPAAVNEPEDANDEEPKAPETTTTPVASEAVTTPTGNEPAAAAQGRRIERPAGEWPKTTERIKHIFGVHTWHLVENDGPELPVLRCFGCRTERPLTPVAEPITFPRADDVDAPERHEHPGDQSSSRPEAGQRPSAKRREEESQQESLGAGTILRKLLSSPWWVKLVAVFVIAQLAGVVASLFGGSGS